VAGYNADGIPATASDLNYPCAIAFDVAGNMYIADRSNNRIRKVDITGIISTVAGNGTSGYAGDLGLATAAKLYVPYGVWIDSAGNVLIADEGNNCIRKVTTTGVISTIAGNGMAGFSGDGMMATNAQLNTPRWVMTDFTGNILIADIDNERIRKINASGIITTLAGIGSPGYSGDGIPATAAGMEPQALAVDSIGNVFMSDVYNARIRKIDIGGIVSTIAGNGLVGFSGDNCLATTAEMNSPYGVVRDVAGVIYFTDPGNNRIRRIMQNHPPTFTGGDIQTITICENTTDSINSLLAITDADTAQTENWSVLSGPSHGTVAGAYVGISTTGTVTPTGLYYTPVAGYTGSDTFKIRVTDCGNGMDTTTICVSIVPPLTVSAITGKDTVCIDDTIHISDVSTGGVWSASNTHATISAGVVTGITTGLDTISYTVSNVCGPVAATHLVMVRSCPYLGMGQTSITSPSLHIWPNPNEGDFFLNFSGVADGPVKYVITNVLGQQLLELISTTNQDTEVRPGIAPGLYFVTAITEEGRVTDKVLMQ